MNGSNPLNDIAANLGVTPQVLTELAIGDDRDFRELVRGILSMLPEPEVTQVASDPDINPEFLEYLCRLFESNTNVLLTILQNPAANTQTKHYILGRLSEDILTSLLKNPRTPPEIRQIITQTPKRSGENMASSNQGDEFKIKMKVSRLLNDLEANIGLTIDAFLKIRAKDDEQSQEFVREVYNALPENNVLLVSRDPSTTPTILNYLSRLFDSEQKILLTILHNPSADTPTKRAILDRIPEKLFFSLAESAKTPPELLELLGEYSTSSELLAALFANPSTPSEAKEKIQIPPVSESPEEAPSEMLKTVRLSPSEVAEEILSNSDEVDAKIALCIDKLHDINADLVTEFIKQAKSEINKRLNLITRANRVILRTLVHHPSLSVEELDHINMDMFVSLLKKRPEELDDQTVLTLLKESKKEQ